MNEALSVHDAGMHKDVTILALSRREGSPQITAIKWIADVVFLPFSLSRWFSDTDKLLLRRAQQHHAIDMKQKMEELNARETKI